MFTVMIKHAPQWNAHCPAFTGTHVAAMAALKKARAKGWIGYVTNEPTSGPVSMVARMVTA